jgi:hypothetical protein
VYPNEYRAILDLEALPDEMNVLRYRQTEAPAPAFGFGTLPPANQITGDDVADDEPDPFIEPEAKAVRTKADSYTPTDAMAEEAQRGLDWRQEFGRGGTEVGVARARDIANKRGLSLDTVERMVSYFARHEVDKQGQGWSEGEDGYPSAGRIAWALWGGDAGRTWAEAIADDNDDTEPTGTEGKSARKADRACECVSCGKGGGSVVKAADDAGAAGGDRAASGVRSNDAPDLTKLKAFETEWDDTANVPKSTLRIFTDFAERMNTWYVATIPSMVNDSAGVDPPGPKSMEAFGKITDDFIGKVLTNGAAVNIAKLPGVTESTWNIANEPAMAYIRSRGLELAKSVPDTLVGVVQSAIEKELAAGTTVDKIRDAIRAEAPQLSGYEAERLARTETTNAFVEGGRQAWVEAGVQKKRWLLAGGPCPECEAVAAKYPNEIPIDEPFESNGWVGQGPSRHPNCRCDLAPGLEYDDNE